MDTVKFGGNQINIIEYKTDVYFNNFTILTAFQELFFLKNIDINFPLEYNSKYIINIINDINSKVSLKYGFSNIPLLPPYDTINKSIIICFYFFSTRYKRQYIYVSIVW